jgi:hypothetical protein
LSVGSLPGRIATTLRAGDGAGPTIVRKLAFTGRPAAPTFSMAGSAPRTACAVAAPMDPTKGAFAAVAGAPSSASVACGWRAYFNTCGGIASLAMTSAPRLAPRMARSS